MIRFTSPNFSLVLWWSITTVFIPFGKFTSPILEICVLEELSKIKKRSYFLLSISKKFLGSIFFSIWRLLRFSGYLESPIMAVTAFPLLSRYSFIAKTDPILSGSGKGWQCKRMFSAFSMYVFIFSAISFCSLFISSHTFYTYILKNYTKNSMRFVRIYYL